MNDNFNNSKGFSWTQQGWVPVPNSIQVSLKKCIHREQPLVLDWYECVYRSTITVLL